MRGLIQRLPGRIENAPDLFEGLELYYYAYADLTTDRPAAFGGALPMPWSSCARYAQFHGFDYEQFDDLVYFVRALDLEFMAWWDRKNPPPKKGAIGGR